MRGPKSERKRRTSRSSEVPGQFVFDFSDPPIIAYPEDAPVRPQASHEITNNSPDWDSIIQPFDLFYEDYAQAALWEYTTDILSRFPDTDVHEPVLLSDRYHLVARPGFGFWREAAPGSFVIMSERISYRIVGLFGIVFVQLVVLVLVILGRRYLQRRTRESRNARKTDGSFDVLFQIV